MDKAASTSNMPPISCIFLHLMYFLCKSWHYRLWQSYLEATRRGRGEEKATERTEKRKKGQALYLKTK